MLGHGPKMYHLEKFSHNLCVFFLNFIYCDYCNWKDKCMLIVGKYIFKDKTERILYEKFYILHFQT